MLTVKIPNAWRLFHLPSNYDYLNAPVARLVYQLRADNFNNLILILVLLLCVINDKSKQTSSSEAYVSL